jgi:hypothetical protein
VTSEIGIDTNLKPEYSNILQQHRGILNASISLPLNVSFPFSPFDVSILSLLDQLPVAHTNSRQNATLRLEIFFEASSVANVKQSEDEQQTAKVSSSKYMLYHHKYSIDIGLRKEERRKKKEKGKKFLMGIERTRYMDVWICGYVYL